MVLGFSGREDQPRLHEESRKEKIKHAEMIWDFFINELYHSQRPPQEQGENRENIDEKYTCRILRELTMFNKKDYSYHLPEGLIAAEAVHPHHDAKLMVVDRHSGAITAESTFWHLGQFL